MNSPFDPNAFRHYLNFISLGFVDLYEISEPSGFDVANFVVKQNDGRYSRDVIYGNDQTNLMFYDGAFELSDTEQLQDLNGRTSFYLDNGLNWILETNRRFGFEGQIEYILKKDGLTFTTGLLDMANPDTDGNTYYGCIVIQNNQISDYKKHESTVINMFGDKNAAGETITPAETIKFLRKAVPAVKTSSFNCLEEAHLEGTSTTGSSDTHYFYVNNLTGKVTDQIDETLVISIPNALNFDGNDDNFDDQFTIIHVRKPLSNIKINITNLIITESTNSHDGGNGYAENQFIVRWGHDMNAPIGESIPIIFTLDDEDSYTNTVHDFEINIPSLPIDAKIWVFLKCKLKQSAIIGAIDVDIVISRYNLSITADVFALDTVVKGVRYIDMMRQCSKFVNALPIDAPSFDISGQFYDQVCYNRALISQNTTKPFTTTFSELMGSAMEVNADYEIQEDRISQIQYRDYYTNTEIGVFQTIPSESYKEPINPRFKINLFRYSYDIFEENRLTEDTTRDIHTESEWIIPNKMAFDAKEVANYLIRSALSQQVAVDLEITKPQTADENDDKVYIVDIVPLEGGAFCEFSAELQMGIIDGKLNLYNKKSTAAASEVVIDWTLIGVETGMVFSVLSGENSGSYVVNSVTKTMLILSPISFTPAFVGDSFISMKFLYNDVGYKTRANEGFDTITGDTDRNNYPNLVYTIRRNMFHWESFLNTALRFNQDKTIRNSYFKNDPDLTTQFMGGVTYTEKADIPVSTLQAPILTPKLFELTVVADFYQMLTLLELLKTDRGFIRCYDLEGKVIKGYIQSLDYIWKTNELKLTLEERYESDVLLLQFVDGYLIVNDTLYDLEGNADWYQMNNEYFTAFDSNSIPICNIRRYDSVSLNGVIYGSEEELWAALIAL